MSVGKISFGLLAAFIGYSGTAYCAPDLVISEISGPSSGIIGGTVTLSHTVCNQGTDGTTGEFVDTVSLMDASEPWQELQISSIYVDALAAGECKSGNQVAEIPVWLEPWNYYLRATADGGYNVAESNEMNNSMDGNQISIGLGTAFDLAPTGMYAVQDGTKMVLVTDVVRNLSTSPSPSSFTVSYYLSTNTTYEPGVDIPLASSSDGTGTCSRTVPELLGGARDSVFNKICYKPQGAVKRQQYYVLAVDDSGNTVSEANETNNVMATGNVISW